MITVNQIRLMWTKEIIFGIYPYELHWRPLVSMLSLFSLLYFSYYRRYWSKLLGYGWIAGIVGMAVLMKGGILGLKSVPTEVWGGLPLTLLLSIFGLADHKVAREQICDWLKTEIPEAFIKLSAINAE